MRRFPNGDGSRNPYFDLLRGCAILMVIGIHTFPADIRFGSAANNAAILVRQTLNCAVPLFLAISGYFLVRKTAETYRTFLKKQLPTLYLPCLLWSVPFAVSAVRHGDSPLTTFAMTLICGMSVYYFIALIIQYYLLLPVLQTMTRTKWVLCGVISLVSVTATVYLRLTQLPLIFYAGFFPLWILFFATGLRAGSGGGNLRLCNRLFALGMAVAGLVLSYGEAVLLTGLGNQGFGIKPSAFLYALGMILFLFSSETKNFMLRRMDHPLCRTLALIGRMSLGIYFTHMFFIFVFKKLGINAWGMLFLCTALADAICVWAARQTLPAFLNRYMGFR